MKIFWRVIIGVTLLILVSLSLCYTLLPSIVSHSLSKRAQVSVSIAGISLRARHLKVNKLSLGNPPSSILPQALKINTIDVQVPLSHFFHEKIVIPSMELSNIYLGLEFNSRSDHRGNWTYIMKNLNDANEGGTRSQSTTEVLIRKLTLSNLTVAIVYKDRSKDIQTIHIPSLEFTDVSSQGGIPAAQITELVMRYALQQIFSKENLQNMIKDIISPSRQGNFFDSFKGLFSIDIKPTQCQQEEL